MAEQNTRRRYPWVLLWILALVFATAGGAVGGSLITSKDIKDRTIRNRDIAEGTIRNNRIYPDGLNASAIGAGAVRASELGVIIQANSGSVGVSAGSTVTAFAPCPDGSRVIGGGGGGSSVLLFAVASYRWENGWRWRVHNTSGNYNYAHAYVYCLLDYVPG